MKMEPFELERWQSVWENRVELNISESGVEPMTLAELAGEGEALAALMRAPLGYPQTNGSEATRAGVARLFLGATADNVLITAGGSEANFVTAWALLEPGDEVVFLQPNYMQVAGVARGLGAKVRSWWLREELQWQGDPDELARLVRPKTKLIAVCNPSNPTGAVMSEAVMNAVCAATEKTGAWILADEIYRGAERGGETTNSFWGRCERLVCTGGFSKAYGLPGLRLGWAVGPADFIDKLWGYHDYTSIAPTALSDRLATLALEPERHAQIIQRTRGIIAQQYPSLADWLAAHGAWFNHVPPAAGAIAWLGWRGAGRVEDLATRLRDEQSVLVVPGSQFGMEKYLRVGFGHCAEKLARALARISETLRAEQGRSRSA
jgi:hypothetical protein